MRKKTSIFTFACFSQAVSTGVPEDLAGLGVAERQQGNLAVLLQRPVEIPQLSINLGNNDVGAQILGNIAQERARGGLEGFGGNRMWDIAIANIELDVDLGVRAVLGVLEVLLPEFLEQVVALDHDLGENIGARGLLGFRVRIFRRGSRGFRSVAGLRFGGRTRGEVLGGFGRHIGDP